MISVIKYQELMPDPFDAKMVPEWIVLRVRVTCVESNLSEIPSFPGAHCLRQRHGIIVRISMPEGLFCGTEEVLAVDESHGPERGGFGVHLSKK